MLAINTISYNNRATLHSVVRTMVENTTFPPGTVWNFVLQNCDSEFCDKIVEICKDKIEICLIRFANNIGLSKALRFVIEHTKYYKYVLLNEDDFKLMKHLTPNKDWLLSCLKFMEQKQEVSTVFLRHYSTEKEKAQYGFSKKLNYLCFKFENFNYEEKMKDAKRIEFEGMTFTHLRHYLYSNNPHICRNADYHKHAYNPFPVFDNDSKIPGATSNFGYAEALLMERIRDLTCYYLPLIGHMEDLVPPEMS